jgi:hypothetical protein
VLEILFYFAIRKNAGAAGRGFVEGGAEKEGEVPLDGD